MGAQFASAVLTKNYSSAAASTPVYTKCNFAMPNRPRARQVPCKYAWYRVTISLREFSEAHYHAIHWSEIHDRLRPGPRHRKRLEPPRHHPRRESSLPGFASSHSRRLRTYRTAHPSDPPRTRAPRPSRLHVALRTRWSG